MDASPSGTSAPEGWYPDSTQTGLLRHWTGTAWTEEWAPIPDPSPAAPLSPVSAARDPLYVPAPEPRSDGWILRTISKVIAVVVAAMGLGRLVSGILLLRMPDGGLSGWALIDSLVGLGMATVGLLALVRPSWVSFRLLRPGEQVDRTPSWIERLGPFPAVVLRAAAVTCGLGAAVYILLSRVNS
jgi:hypothetical protein